MTISTAADCNGLPSGWIRSFCALTLRPDWQAIIGPTDPLPDPADGTDSVTWFASLARAEIDGDTTLCSDVAMRMWITMGSGLGGAPPPGTTPTPVHPIAACLDSIRRTAAAGSFTVDGPAYHVTAQQLARTRFKSSRTPQPSSAPRAARRPRSTPTSSATWQPSTATSATSLLRRSRRRWAAGSLESRQSAALAPWPIVQVRAQRVLRRQPAAGSARCWRAPAATPATHSMWPRPAGSSRWSRCRSSHRDQGSTARRATARRWGPGWDRA